MSTPQHRWYRCRICLTYAVVAMVLLAALISVLVRAINDEPSSKRPNAQTSITLNTVIEDYCFHANDVIKCAVKATAHEMEALADTDTRWGFGTDKPITNIDKASQVANDLMRSSNISLDPETHISLTVDLGEIVEVHLTNEGAPVSALVYP